MNGQSWTKASLIWLLDPKAFFDFWLAFNLGGLGLMLALIAWLFATTPVDMPTDMQVAIVAGAVGLSLLTTMACVRLALARYRLGRQEQMNSTTDSSGR